MWRSSSALKYCSSSKRISPWFAVISAGHILFRASSTILSWHYMKSLLSIHSEARSTSFPSISRVLMSSRSLFWSPNKRMRPSKESLILFSQRYKLKSKICALIRMDSVSLKLLLAVFKNQSRKSSFWTKCQKRLLISHAIPTATTLSQR